MDVGDDAAACDGGLDQGVQLLVSSDGQLVIVTSLTPELIRITMSNIELSRLSSVTCRCLGVILLTFRSLEALPANSRTSAVRYSRMAELYTAAVAPTLQGGVSVLRLLLLSDLLPPAGKAPALEMSVDPPDWELQAGSGRPRDGFLFGFA